MAISIVIVLLSLSLTKTNCLNAQGENTSSDLLLHRKCLVVAESSVYSMVNKPSPEQCPGIICWQSQLTVLNKAKITRMYNEFRNKWANTEKSNGVIRMKWHWSLEDEALKIISSCPAENLYEFKFTRNIEGLDNSLSCEYRVAEVSLEELSQQNFLKDFPSFLEKNTMLDLDKNQKFRRSSVMHFGCSLTITNSTENRSRFVCVYCSKEKSVSYVSENCTKYTAKNVSASEFPHLCHASKYVDLYGCEPKQVCSSSSQPEFWKTPLVGELEKYYMVRSNRGLWLVVNRTNYEIEGTKLYLKSDLSFAKPVDNSWFLDYSSPSEYTYVYDEETMKLLKSSSSSFLSSLLSHETLRQKRIDKTTKMIKYQGIEPEGDFYPTCCIYLFILNLILFVALLVLINFTYEHYKNKHT